MRINVLPVELLSNVHLRAEYREIIMSIHYYKRSSRSKNGIDLSKISKKYTLNGGHAYFFFNKFGYVMQRFFQLKNEMEKRGYQTKNIADKFVEAFDSFIPKDKSIVGEYKPTIEDYQINIDRILRRIRLRPEMYSERSFEQWGEVYSRFLDNNHFITRLMNEVEEDFRRGELGKHLKYKEKRRKVNE